MNTLTYGYVAEQGLQAQAQANGECQRRGFSHAILISDELSLRFGRDRLATFRCVK